MSSMETAELVFVIVSSVCLMPGCSEQPGRTQAKTHDVVITGNPAGGKIIAIKGIREVAGLGLAEAIALYDNMPSVVKRGVSKEDAESAAEQLRASGLTAEIREERPNR